MISPYIKHCVKSVIIWSYAGPYSVQTWENKNQNNSEYGQFSCSDRCRINPLLSRVFFLHPPKISENCRFFYILWTYKWVKKKGKNILYRVTWLKHSVSGKTISWKIVIAIVESTKRFFMFFYWRVCPGDVRTHVTYSKS